MCVSEGQLALGTELTHIWLFDQTVSKYAQGKAVRALFLLGLSVFSHADGGAVLM